ncbi:hypothetical protein [Streptomyces noursei]|uniref:hypothetical protein n=1 Tax=Streptomyces noursei TaxID=1971 RepID=UPI00382727DF
MIHINLPSGASADLRDVADVTERQRRPIKRIQSQLAARPAFAAAVKEAQAISGAELSPEAELRIAAGMGDAFDLLEELNDFLVAALVAGWSYGFPVTADAVQDIPGADLDALRTECAPFLPKLLPDFEPTAEADSPTVPSGA